MTHQEAVKTLAAETILGIDPALSPSWRQWALVRYHALRGNTAPFAPDEAIALMLRPFGGSGLVFCCLRRAK